jgi:hypothetical protein
MSRNPRVALLAGFTVTTYACSAAVPPAETAARVARTQCETSSEAAGDFQLLATAKVIGFEPLYSHVLTGRNNSEERLTGAKLLVRPTGRVHGGANDARPSVS